MAIARFLREEAGQDLIEYALLGSFVALAAIAGASFLGTALQNWYSNLGSDVNDSASGTIPSAGS